MSTMINTNIKIITQQGVCESTKKQYSVTFYMIENKVISIDIFPEIFIDMIKRKSPLYIKFSNDKPKSPQEEYEMKIGLKLCTIIIDKNKKGNIVGLELL